MEPEVEPEEEPEVEPEEEPEERPVSKPKERPVTEPEDGQDKQKKNNNNIDPDFNEPKKK